jgi:putative phage-type endonuclease
MKVYDCQQGTPEWFECRKGRLTASTAQAIASNGKGLETLVYEIMAEAYSKNTEHYTNEDMERGHELEDMARNLYTLETGNVVEQVGFIERDEYVGCSPDGLIGEEGGLEIKCPNDKNHLYTAITGEYDKKYYWQVQMTLLITGRKWWDLVFFNPNLPKELIIKRLIPESQAFDKLEAGIKKGIELIKIIKQKYG